MSQEDLEETLETTGDTTSDESQKAEETNKQGGSLEEQPIR